MNFDSYLNQTTISDLIQISPEDFSKLSAVAIEDNINEKYANKVCAKCPKLALLSILIGTC